MTQPNTSWRGNKLFVFVRSAIFFVGMVIATLAITPTMLLLFPVSTFFFRYKYLAGAWVFTVLWLLKKVCGLGFKVEGLENIPQETAIIFSKHQSAWETLALQTVFPPLVFILKRELLWVPIFGWALATCDPIAIDRESKRQALKRVVEIGIKRLKNKRWIVIFPEGTRVAPGAKKKYSGSGGLLAQKSGCPVIPVAHNAGEFWPRKSFRKYPGVIQMRIGPVIESTGKSASQITEEAEAWIEGEMSKITVHSQHPC